MAADFLRAYQGRSVLLTGHTGFKGAWLTMWLSRLGAKVTGLALAPDTDPMSLFYAARADRDMTLSTIGDIRDLETVVSAVEAAQPDIVIHMAAQSLVRPSYVDPVGTFSTNVMGTIHVLEAVRLVGGVKAVVNVTSDKCYENNERDAPFIEADAMGGNDPYSASKGCAELITNAYRRSFFSNEGETLLASARAGNVVGGGDMATDRLIPDIVRAAQNDETLVLRQPDSTRPWQHVLEPLCGYLALGARLLAGERDKAQGYNFGPAEIEPLPVHQLAEKVVAAWQRGEVELSPEPRQPHEAKNLKLDITKAKMDLGYTPLFNVGTAIDMTVSWYKAVDADPSQARIFTEAQIDDYMGYLG